MAEFDGQALSAIDDFFRKDGPSSSSQNGLASLSPSLPPSWPSTHTPSKRAGVGSVPISRQGDKFVGDGVNNVVTKRLLQVGRKRQRNEQDHVADEDVELSNDIEADDDDEEVGRTAIDLSETKPADWKISTSLLVKSEQEELIRQELEKKQKKKKKGRKEREREKMKILAAEGRAPNPDDAKKETQAEDVDLDTDPQPIMRRKRPKIRSKQKNIVKDKRTEKPKHLVLGKDYQGRPLTAETRAKLNLPKVDRDGSNNAGSWRRVWQDDGASFRPRDSFAINPGFVDGLPLAVDAMPEQQLLEPKKVEKKKKKNKRPKYKNLR